MTALTEETLVQALQKLHININQDIREVSQSVQRISDRILALEEGSDLTSHARHVAPPASLGPGGAHAASQETPGVEDAQAAFSAVQDSVSRVRLDPGLKLRYSPQGIKRDQRPLYDIITKAAKYPETTLKVLSTLKPGETLTEETIEQLFIVQEAEIKWLQDELAGVVVASEFEPNSRTTRWFKVMQKNSSVFTADALENLRSAASIGAIAPESRPSGRGVHRGARFGQRQRGSFNFRGGQRYQRGQRYNRDVFAAQVDQQNIAGSDN